MTGSLSACVITCPGRVRDSTFAALEVAIEGLKTPYHLVMALPVCTADGIAQQVDTVEVYEAISKAINGAGLCVGVSS